MRANLLVLVLLLLLCAALSSLWAGSQPNPTDGPQRGKPPYHCSSESPSITRTLRYGKTGMTEPEILKACEGLQPRQRPGALCVYDITNEDLECAFSDNSKLVQITTGHLRFGELSINKFETAEQVKEACAKCSIAIQEDRSQGILILALDQNQIRLYLRNGRVARIEAHIISKTVPH